MRTNYGTLKQVSRISIANEYNILKYFKNLKSLQFYKYNSVELSGLGNERAVHVARQKEAIDGRIGGREQGGNPVCHHSRLCKGRGEC